MRVMRAVDAECGRMRDTSGPLAQASAAETIKSGVARIMIATGQARVYSEA